MPLLEIRNMAASYGAVRALQGVSMNVEAGSVVALLGSNGAGKSTTLKAISGMVRPAEGDIVFDGESITSATSVVLQAGILDDTATVVTS